MTRSIPGSTEGEANLRAALLTIERDAPAPADLTARLLAGLQTPFPRRASKPRWRRSWWSSRWSSGLLAVAVVAVIAAVSALLVSGHVLRGRQGDSASTFASTAPAPSAVDTAAAKSAAVAAARGRAVEAQAVARAKAAAAAAAKAHESAAGVVLGPWAATTVGGQGAAAQPVAGDSDSLYVISGHTSLLRLDPSTGDVLARMTSGVELGRDFLIVGGALWLPPESAGGAAQVRAVDLHTLSPIATISLPSGGAMAADPTVNRLYVATGDMVTVIDAASRRVVGSYQAVPASLTVDWLATLPGSGRLWIVSDISGDGELREVDAGTGDVLDGPVSIGGGGGEVSVSPGGVWLNLGSGMSLEVVFRHLPDLNPGGLVGIGGGGGYPVSTTITPTTVWLGGSGGFGCADPATGAIRARAQLSSRYAVNLAHFTVAGEQLFGYIQADDRAQPALVRLNPPSVCGS